MTKPELVDAIIAEMDRVWGTEGFEGTDPEYEWLAATYGITEENDVQWQLVLQDDRDELPEEDLEDEEVMSFLTDERAVIEFLESFLQKYQSSSAVRSAGPSLLCSLSSASFHSR